MEGWFKTAEGGLDAGAAGAAGVDATGGGAGVDGPLGLAAGAALGYVLSVKDTSRVRRRGTDLGDHTHNEALLFNLV